MLLKNNPVHFVSPGIDAAMVHDPEGHVLLLEESADGR
jgi:hypothetical protein